MAAGMGMGMGMNPGHNVPFLTAVGPMGLQGQWSASAAAPFGNPLGDMSMLNLLNPGAGHGLAGGMKAASGMNMGPSMIDPQSPLAHQQATMITKKTYQLAIAQQAMRDAADEWERGSAIGGWASGRPSVGTPVLGMGTGLTMNAGGGGGMGAFAGSSFPVLGSGGMWPGGAMPGFPGNAARTMFTGNPYAASEIGVAGAGSDRGGPAGWATSSVYGESFGVPRDRSLRAYCPIQMHQVTMASGGGPATQANKWEGSRPRTKAAPSGASGRQHTGSVGVKKRGEGGN